MPREFRIAVYETTSSDLFIVHGYEHRPFLANASTNLCLATILPGPAVRDAQELLTINIGYGRFGTQFLPEMHFSVFEMPCSEGRTGYVAIFMLSTILRCVHVRLDAPAGDKGWMNVVSQWEDTGPEEDAVTAHKIHQETSILGGWKEGVKIEHGSPWCGFPRMLDELHVTFRDARGEVATPLGPNTVSNPSAAKMWIRAPLMHFDAEEYLGSAVLQDCSVRDVRDYHVSTHIPGIDYVKVLAHGDTRVPAAGTIVSPCNGARGVMVQMTIECTKGSGLAKRYGRNIIRVFLHMSLETATVHQVQLVQAPHASCWVGPGKDFGPGSSSDRRTEGGFYPVLEMLLHPVRPHPSCLPLLLNNDSVLEGRTSAKALQHQWLPLRLEGFGR